MMKKQLLFVVCVLAIQYTKAQTPPQVPYPSMGLVQGELYHNDLISVSAGAPAISNASFKYIKDTIISSNIYSYFTAGYAGQWDSYYTRYSNGKIYHAGRNIDGSAGSEVLKYDFTLLVGNTINLQFMGILTVDSIASITLLNGQVRKYMRLRNSYLQKIEWIDGIGDIHNGFLYQFGAEGEHNEFICAHDNSDMLYKSNSVLDCDSLTSSIVSVKEQSAEVGLLLSPNPTHNLIKVDFQNDITSNITMQVMDVFGQTVYSKTLESGTFETSIDLTPYENGIYFIRVSTGKMVSIKKIVKL